MGQKVQKFVELCEQYGEGRLNPENWGSKAEDKVLKNCTHQFNELLSGGEELDELFGHQSEFVRYLAAVNAITLRTSEAEARLAILALRDDGRAKHMQMMAYLIAIHFKLD